MIQLKEADIKRAVQDRLQLAQNQGQLLFLRLNSGDFIEVRGTTRRRVKGCPPGTADYVVFQPVTGEPGSGCRVTFVEIKSSKGETSKEQKEFAEKIRMMNCYYAIVRDADDLAKHIKTEGRL